MSREKDCEEIEVVRKELKSIEKVYGERLDMHVD